jgi:hypothetical protein
MLRQGGLPPLGGVWRCRSTTWRQGRAVVLWTMAWVGPLCVASRLSSRSLRCLLFLKSPPELGHLVLELIELLLYASILGCVSISTGLQNSEPVGGHRSRVSYCRHVEAQHPSGWADRHAIVEGEGGSWKMGLLARVSVRNVVPTLTSR